MIACIYQLKEMSFLKSAKVNFDTVEWEHAADIDPKTIPYNKCAAYQELLIDKYVQDIRHIQKNK